ncbi:MAG: MBOAT family protein [Verrucomicrobia bacterium]|nr:MBOAT family protein [Verrucomicrobiota bacterium]NBU10388.1 MBOAT family protein [Pseudomonadota bacterium]NDA68377.1 MBOAT family protein [Verrucomicrobiota bacterium]NDB75638.1 MBOAT family protein [Verrucomicrobiota bacterium]NDD40018.1 MBOAT family protein [Verrucomicrobiota bacterium]
MLFHTWTFFVYLLVVVPGFLLLRKTRLWIPWLLLASYVFYGWWNPYYLILVAYSTALDFILVALMDHCPLGRPKVTLRERLAHPRFDDTVLKVAFLVSALGTLGFLGMAVAGLPTLRPTMAVLTLIFGLMAVGAFFASRAVWLGVSIVNNLAILLFFKYAQFLVENGNALFVRLKIHATLPDPASLMPFGAAYVLPVGISFFTFQSMSYSIDFYRGRVHRERDFIRFAAFVSFFPQLMAGPIERASHLLPQFYEFPKITSRDVTDGLSLFLVGLFKKLALANYLSYYVERVYDNPKAYGAPALILGTVAFAWQIFFDFSGYTDMARGIAKLMGFNLMLNFNNPYLATGLGDFWSRWHISLSTWFRDYLYIPLGGNKEGTFKMYRNLFITFFVSGIWHGANWTFVIWGLLHAFGVMVTRELEHSAFYRDRVPRLIKQLGVFAFVCFAWIFFRAGSMTDAWLILQRIFTTGWMDPQMPLLMLGIIAAIWLYQMAYESKFRPVLQTSIVRVGAAVLMILYMFLCSSGGGAFIYFQF